MVRMSRFEALLAVILPEMEFRAGYGHETYARYCERLARAQSKNTSQLPKIRQEDVVDDQLWTIWDAAFLWPDRFLSLRLHEDEGNPWYFSWYGATRSDLEARVRDPHTRMLLFATHFWELVLPYQADRDPHFREAHPQDAWKLDHSEPLRERYRKTRFFFGSAFDPLMKAFIHFVSGAPKNPLPLMRDGGSCSLAVSEANRLVIGYLGIPGYSVLFGRKRLSDAEVRVPVALADYSEEDQQRVATVLMSNQRSRLDARLAFCELAFRGIIPEGQYVLQMESLS
jgi:hypothetical protein